MGAVEREKHIPKEVLSGILLSNLPIKTLLRFKSVSKSWRSLITSPEFVQDHLNISQSDPDFVHHRLIANHYKHESGLNLRSCSLEPLFDEPNQNGLVSTHDHPYPTTRDTISCSVQILGSCNGLLFINNTHGFSLWNPTTRKVKNIPEPSSSPPHQGKYYYVCGFGYDESTRDYKVVFVMCYSVEGSPDQEIHQTNIYSVGTNSWKKFKNFGKSFYTEYAPGMFANGKLHWIGAKETERYYSDKWSIVSLDLVEGQEKYQIMALPPKYDSGQKSLKLEILGGYLSLICSSYYDDGMMDYMSVWVMNEYGVAESWTKIREVNNHSPRRPIAYCRPFWVTWYGDLFMLFTKWATNGNESVQSENVVVYNRGIKSREYPLDRYELDDQYSVWQSYPVGEHTYRPIVYVESLVSP